MCLTSYTSLPSRLTTVKVQQYKLTSYQVGARGPKPVDVERLKSVAKDWATLLFALRDGGKGVAEKWGQQLVVELVVRKDRRKTEALLRDLQKRDYRIGWPVYPSPEIWEQLKRARSLREAKQCFARLRQWRRRELPGLGNDDWLHEFRSNPRHFLQAKRLPNYPREAETNDDKRVAFLAKVFAGLEAHLAPLTATKKLSHWRCDNYWKTVGIQYVASSKMVQKGAKK
jgi:hypothetical protein